MQTFLIKMYAHYIVKVNVIFLIHKPGGKTCLNISKTISNPSNMYYAICHPEVELFWGKTT